MEGTMIKKILNYGSLNIDRVYQVEHFVTPGETISSTKMDIFPGGKGLNQSIALARAGASVYHAGTIGEDGLFLKEALEKSGVDCRYIEVTDSPTGHANIQVDEKGENAIILFKGSNFENSKDQMYKVIDDFSEGDVLVLQNEINDIEYLMTLAKQKGMKIMLNPSPMNDELRNLDLSSVTWLILNEIEGNALTGEQDKDKILKELSQKYPDTAIILTLGSNGAFYQDKNVTYFQPCFECKVVDTTAAGDTFTGYFLAGIAAGLSQNDAMEQAAMAASIAVSRVGASSSIPDYEEVVGQINNHN